MKKGISLIELIFTIVIIAVIFTVIPKIVLSLSKSDEFSVKQDALFNGFTTMQMISRLAWDENSATSNDILQTSGNSNFTCNQTLGNYRIGGFVGSRNCDEHNATLSASPIGKDAVETLVNYNDIDDFDDEVIYANASSEKKYGLHVKVEYISDDIDYSAPKRAIIKLNKTGVASTTSLKIVDINVTYQGKRGELDTPISQFRYVSANIGKSFLNKRTW